MKPIYVNVYTRSRKKGSKWRAYKAKLDTGAEWSRIGAREAAKLGLGPIVGVRKIRTSSGHKELRIIVPAKLKMGGHLIAARFSISTRVPGVLIGQKTMGKRVKVTLVKPDP